jgi:hypothetical protein
VLHDDLGDSLITVRVANESRDVAWLRFTQQVNP